MKVITGKTDLTARYDLRNISPLREMLFFDIETTGLRKETTQLYLIGCGFFDEEGTFTVRQWLTESAGDEREILQEFIEFAKDFSTLVHFNGYGFDIPYIAYKAEYYGMTMDFVSFKNLDIYKEIRHLKKFLGLPRMNQTTVEDFLKVEREDTMDGGKLIPYYYEYEKNGDPLCEHLLLLHNFDDIKGMLQLTSALAYADVFKNGFEYKGTEVVRTIEGPAVVIIEGRLENPVPVPVSHGKKLYEDEDDLLICMENELLQINLRLFEGEGRLPLKDVENYYYLPAEDRVIHKDVGAFVDKRFRKKATAKNCFLKTEGQFAPCFCTDFQGRRVFEIPCVRGRRTVSVPALEADVFADLTPEEGRYLLETILATAIR
ncbi:MAG: ribonuclease H-like domain-containing protein [Lachnospiraceae bacterium]